MKETIFLIISLLIFFVGIVIVVDIFNKSKEDIIPFEMKKNTQLISNEINNYCRNPFLSNKINIEYNGGYQLYHIDDKVCAKNENELICEKIDCIFTNKTFIENFNLNIKYNCEIVKNSSRYQINC